MKFISNKERARKLHERIDAVRPLLPKGYKNILIEMYPEYNTIRGSNLISNIIAYRSSDEKLTAALEEIVKLNNKSDDKD